MGKNWIGVTKKIFIIFLIPIGTFIVLSMLTNMKGIVLFENAGHIKTFVRSTAIIAFTAWALAINLNSGRFDFSLGAIAILSSIIGTQITLIYSFPAFMLPIITVLVAGALGLFSGGLYIILKLPPIITSVGVMLFYEAMTYIITGGEGLLISTKFELLTLPSTRNILLILIIGFLFMFFIMNHTKFGYNHEALKHGQGISVNTGLPEKRNALASYMIAGMLMGIVGFINMTTQGYTSVALNFSSISAMFIAFLPMFIGSFIGRYSEERFGILIGAATMGLVTLGFVRLNIANHNQQFTNAILLMIFLAYLSNEARLKNVLSFRNQSIKKVHPLK